MAINFTWEDTGRFVEYKPANGPVEIGRLHSGNDQVCYVIYDRHMYVDNWPDYYGVATNPKDLYWFEV